MANKKRTVTLFSSKEKRPSVRVTPGMRLDVVSVKLADPKTLKPGKIAARLCGGTSTCLALVDVNPTTLPVRQR